MSLFDEKHHAPSELDGKFTIGKLLTNIANATFGARDVWDWASFIDALSDEPSTSPYEITLESFISCLRRSIEETSPSFETRGFSLSDPINSEGSLAQHSQILDFIAACESSIDCSKMMFAVRPMVTAAARLAAAAGGDTDEPTHISDCHTVSVAAAFIASIAPNIREIFTPSPIVFSMNLGMAAYLDGASFIAVNAYYEDKETVSLEDVFKWSLAKNALYTPLLAIIEDDSLPRGWADDEPWMARDYLSPSPRKLHGSEALRNDRLDDRLRKIVASENLMFQSHMLDTRYPDSELSALIWSEIVIGGKAVPISTANLQSAMMRLVSNALPRDGSSSIAEMLADLAIEKQETSLIHLKTRDRFLVSQMMKDEKMQETLLAIESMKANKQLSSREIISVLFTENGDKTTNLVDSMYGIWDYDPTMFISGLLKLANLADAIPEFDMKRIYIDSAKYLDKGLGYLTACCGNGGIQRRLTNDVKFSTLTFDDVAEQVKNALERYIGTNGTDNLELLETVSASLQREFGYHEIPYNDISQVMSDEKRLLARKHIGYQTAENCSLFKTLSLSRMAEYYETHKIQDSLGVLYGIAAGLADLLALLPATADNNITTIDCSLGSAYRLFYSNKLCYEYQQHPIGTAMLFGDIGISSTIPSTNIKRKHPAGYPPGYRGKIYYLNDENGGMDGSAIRKTEKLDTSGTKTIRNRYELVANALDWQNSILDSNGLMDESEAAAAVLLSQENSTIAIVSESELERFASLSAIEQALINHNRILIFEDDKNEHGKKGIRIIERNGTMIRSRFAHTENRIDGARQLNSIHNDMQSTILLTTPTVMADIDADRKAAGLVSIPRVEPHRLTVAAMRSLAIAATAKYERLYGKKIEGAAIEELSKTQCKSLAELENVIDVSFARANSKNRKSVDSADVLFAKKVRTGVIPREARSHPKATKIERRFGLNVGAFDGIYGQERAISAVRKTLCASLAGVRDDSRPRATLMFVGKSGIGKSLIASRVVKYLGRDDTEMLQLPMETYAERWSISRMFGSDPGYIGYDDGGVLSKFAEVHPEGIVILDEIEKAHPNVVKALLSIFDNGIMTAGNGTRIDCTQMTFICTSNTGFDEVKAPMGFSSNEFAAAPSKQRSIRGKLTKVLGAPFVGRLSEIVVFDDFTEEDIVAAVRMLFDSFASEKFERFSIDIREMVSYSELDELTRSVMDTVDSSELGIRGVWLGVERNLNERLLELLGKEEYFA